MADWLCSASRDLPIRMSDSWDGAAAKAHIFEWAGWPDKPDSSKAKTAFLVWDAAAPDMKGSYKLPFADVVDGNLRADSKGIDAASSRIGSTDASESALSSAQSVIDHYKDRINKMSDKMRSAISPDEVFASDVRVARSTILPVDALTEKARSLMDVSLLDEGHDLYFWGTESSNRSVDTYFTRMATSSLKNYAVDADEGIAFQNSHQTRQLSLGRSLAGKYVTGSQPRTLMDFYTVRGMNLEGMGTDQFILGMRSGVIRDVSIGFYGGWFRCSICNKDMFDWSLGWSEMCQHIPGIEYDIKDKEGNITDRVVALADVEDAHVSEVSAVYDGACPGAAIRKTQIEAAGGRVRPEILQTLEKRYRMRFEGSNQSFAGITLPDHLTERATEVPEKKDREITDQDLLDVAAEAKDSLDTEKVAEPVKEEEAVAEKEETVVDAATTTAGSEKLAEELVDANVDEERLRSSLLEAGINPGTDPKQTLRTLASEIRRLRPLAKDGEVYRNDLIEDTLSRGVVALGNTFDADSYRALLTDGTIENIKKVRAGFGAKADELIPVGRITKDIPEKPLVDEVTPRRETTRSTKAFSNG